MHIFLTEISQLDTLKTHDSFTSTCELCGREYTIHDFRPEPNRLKRYKIFRCQPCYATAKKREIYGEHYDSIVDKASKTYKEKTGYDNPMQNPKVQAKLNETMNKDYGGRGYASRIIRKKCEETNERVNGDPHYNNQKQREQTMNERWGVPFAMWNKDLKQKRIDSDKANNGGILHVQTQDHKLFMSEMNSSHPEWAETSVSKMFEKYGMWWNQTKEAAKLRAEHPEWKEIANNAICEKYGMAYSQTEEYKEMMKTMRAEHPEWKEKASNCLRQDMIDNPEKYIHGPIICGRMHSFDSSFDSIPEFNVFTFCLDHWIPIYRNTTIRLKYYDMFGGEHYTVPDFIINGVLVEIKGGHFYNPDGTWKFPYKKKKVNGKWVPMTTVEMDFMNNLYENKRKCLLANGVLILRDDNPWIQLCREYVSTKYNVLNYMIRKLEYSGEGFTPYNIDTSKEYTSFTEIGKTPFDICLDKEK